MSVTALINPTGFLIAEIAKYALSSISNKENIKSTDLGALQLAAEKQDLQMRMAEAQARVAQELAIAKRIELAEEVEMEEFYDLSGDGSAGLKADEKSVTVGFATSGRRVTKRVYKFKGNRTDATGGEG